ncbi:MAG TPA: XRE family transcriptional regulator [Cyclobacteriaceae bacterium]|nr:XRE family transcriptional regulator [Cyclobacteriaceae bacterium]
MIVNKNLKFLRTRQGMTQKQFADRLGLKQSVIGSYEEERATPPLACLLEISEMFRLSLDALTRQDLSKIPEKEWKAQQFSKGKDVLSITVDREGNENVELVSQKASAGYLNGYADPDFIAELPKINLPVLPRSATYRAFEIKGDSMLPIQPGSIIFGEYVENASSIKNGKLYILVTRDEGIVFKRVFYIEKEEKFLLVSDNRQYDPYTADIDDVLEIWSAKGFFTTKFPVVEGEGLSVSMDHLAMTVVSLQSEIQRLKKK